ncbi:MAG: PEP-CTERM sorting domain-containing protein [Deltaproteobacteria bacterium]|nr:PEP-CTERM sorting domain-containing protein [Deltaproteobacteria bacterium]
MLILLVALVILAAPSGAFAISISYNFAAPIDPATKTPVPTDKIIGFDMDLELLGSRLGQNNSPALPTLAERAIPGFVAGQNILVPNTQDGLDPKTLKDPRFDFDTEVVIKGLDQFQAKVPGAPGGATYRFDKMRLAWETMNKGKAFQFGQGNRLTFGAQVNVENKAFKDKVSLKDSFWTFDDKKTQAASRVALHTVEMGMNQVALNATSPTEGWSFSYTNDAVSEIVLSELRFETRMMELPLDAFGPSVTLGGTSLFNPLVTLDGIIQSIQSFYAIPEGSTLQFLFPSATDWYFTAQGVVSTGGISEFDFAYQAQVVPEPATWAMLATGILVLIGTARGISWALQLRLERLKSFWRYCER